MAVTYLKLNKGNYIVINTLAVTIYIFEVAGHHSDVVHLSMFAMLKTTPNLSVHLTLLS